MAVSYPLVLGMLTSVLSWSWHDCQHEDFVGFCLLFVPDFSSAVDLLLEIIILEYTEVSPAWTIM